MLFQSDRKSTRLNSSHLVISYAVFCLKKKKKKSSYLGQHFVLTESRDQLSQRVKVFQPALFFFFNNPATPEIYPLPLPDALPIGFLFAHPCPDGVSRVPLLPRPRPVAF